MELPCLAMDEYPTADFNFFCLERLTCKTISPIVEIVSFRSSCFLGKGDGGESAL